MPITNIADEPIKGLTIQKLFKTDTCEILLFKLKKDETIPNHITPKRAFLVMHQGDILFQIKGKEIELVSGNTYEIPENVLHNVKAVSDSIFFIFR